MGPRGGVLSFFSSYVGSGLVLQMSVILTSIVYISSTCALFSRY